ncbi:MAG: VOC family protein [Streptosporangiaceae bacterium]
MRREPHPYLRGTGVLGYARDGLAGGRYQTRVISLGARVLTREPVREAGWQWHILADPDGNEFCVLQPPASHWPD